MCGCDGNKHLRLDEEMKDEKGRHKVNHKFGKGDHMKDGNSTIIWAGVHLFNANGSHDTVGNALERILIAHIELGATLTSDANLDPWHNVVTEDFHRTKKKAACGGLRKDANVPTCLDV